METILGLEGGSPAEQAADQAHEELKKEIEAAAIPVQNIEEEKMPTAEIPDLSKGSEEPEAKEEKTEEADAPKAEASEEEEETPKPEEKEEEAIAKIAIPLFTAEELLEKAKAAGEAPKVIQDEDAGVTLLDYSTIIGGKKREEDE